MTRHLERRLRALEATQPQATTAWVHFGGLTADEHAFISAYCDRMVDTDDEATSEDRGRLAAIFDRVTYPNPPARAVWPDWIPHAR